LQQSSDRQFFSSAPFHNSASGLNIKDISLLGETAWCTEAHAYSRTLWERNLSIHSWSTLSKNPMMSASTMWLT